MWLDPTSGKSVIRLKVFIFNRMIGSVSDSYIIPCPSGGDYLIRWNFEWTPTYCWHCWLALWQPMVLSMIKKCIVTTYFNCLNWHTKAWTTFGRLHFQINILEWDKSHCILMWIPLKLVSMGPLDNESLCSRLFKWKYVDWWYIAVTYPLC